MVGRPWLVLFAAGVLVVLALARLVDWPAGRLALDVDPSVRALLPHSGPELERFESVRTRYASDDLLLIAWVGEGLFTPERLAAFKRLTQRIERMPGVEHVESMATAVETVVYEDYTEVRAFLDELPATATAAREVRDAVLGNPLYAGYLVSRDGRGAMIAVRFDPHLSARALIPIVADIGAASRAAAQGVEQFLSGPLYVRLEISRLLLSDLLHVMPLAVLCTLAVLALGFRHVRGVVLPLVANSVALVITLALFVQFGYTLNYVTVILPPTIYVVGFAYAIHVICDFDRRLGELGERRAAVRAALADVAAPVSLTALTTALGFASLTVSDIDAIRTFGAWASLGTVIAWLAALTVVPAGLACLPARARPGQAAGGDRVGARLAALAARRGGWFLAGGLVLTAGSIAGALAIEVDTDYLANFEPDSALRADFDRMNEAFAGAVPLQIVLEADGVDTFKSPAALRAVAELQAWLAAQPDIGGVYTLLDYVGVLEAALAPELVDADPVPESAGLTSHLLLLGASEDVRRFTDAAYASTLLRVRARVAASAPLNALSDRIEARLGTLPDGLRGYVTGSSYLIARTLDDVTRGQVLSLCAAFVPISLVLVAMFRSVKLALLALVPNVLPILAFFGILGWSGVTLNLTTSLVASVVLGIAVDDSIHFFARLRAAARDAPSGDAALRAALCAVVRPVTFTTAGLAVGFCTLVAGELRSQAEFGLLAAATLVIAWALDLTFTPTLARRWGANEPRR